MYIEIKQGRHEYDVICMILRSQDTFSPKCELSTRSDVKVGWVTYNKKVCLYVFVFVFKK